MTRRGPLITVDGPGGIGKSTAIRATRLALQTAGHTVHTTAQPSTSTFGQAVRAAAASMHGRALALAVAADRLQQLDAEVRPHRDLGHTVLLDRYLPSTLVLQRADGVDLDYLLAINDGVDIPDLSVILLADPETIRVRLEHRGTRHRFELDGDSTRRELELYREAAPVLQDLGYTILTIDATHLTPEEIATAIASATPAPGTTFDRTTTQPS
ncbi:dTMP kinase [Streptomyces lavendulocolor]|uniref:dTMP kinase n=1 Tax=Streptomyces lavendulocolor TaxID=67316 RepID=UPI0031D68759